MAQEPPARKKWVDGIVVAVLFTIIGGVILIVFNPWGSLFLVDEFGSRPGRIIDYASRIVIILVLLLAATLLRRSRRLERFWQTSYALFILALAVSLDLIINTYVIGDLGFGTNTLAGWAVPKLNECLVIVAVVLAGTRLMGNDLGSIYIQKGNLKLGLLIGGSTFLAAAALSIPMANYLFGGENLSIGRILPWIPWLLVIVLSNGTLEELLFRGLFLKKLEPFLGKFASNFMVGFVFTVLHLGSSYTSSQYIFIPVLFLLALAWGAIMQKTNSLWGSILFHAGMDIPIFLGIFSHTF